MRPRERALPGGGIDTPGSKPEEYAAFSRIYPVANIKSAAKRARQAETRRQRNVALRSRMRTAIKKATKAIEEALAGGDLQKAADAFRASSAAVDAMVTKGVIHRNKAARHKSRQAKALRKAATGTGTAKPAAAKAAPARKKAATKKASTKKAAAKD
jgi:small subunit ribosomal protein S20